MNGERRTARGGTLAPAAPTASIVIPVFNRAELTRQCLEALAAVTTGSFEVIVVDNGSTDATPAMLRTFGAALTVVRHDENHGFARACNAGARCARGTHLVFLNNDTVPRPGWLAAMLDPIAADARVGVVGSRLLYPDETIQHAGIAFSPDFEPVHVQQGVPAEHPSVLVDRDCDAVTGACLLIPRTLFTELGGFDEGYRMYFEDVDLCLRARAAGRSVRYAAASVLVHLERGSSPSFGAAYALNRESRMRFRARWLEAAPPSVELAALPDGPDGVPGPEGATPAPRARTGAAGGRRLAVLFQARATLFSQRGGDTVVVERLMDGLAACGVAVRFGAEPTIPPGTDLVHTINFATPETTRRFAEEAERAGVPLVVTTLYEDWPRCLGLQTAAAMLFQLVLDPAQASARAGLDRSAITAALGRLRDAPTFAAAANDRTVACARVLLACSESERRRLQTDYPLARDVRVVPFGADQHDERGVRVSFADVYGVRDYVLCVGRLESRKNQLMLLEALRDETRPVVLVGGGTSYSPIYDRLCREFRRRGPTLVLDRLPSAMLAAAFREAAVHCLPSWYELPGLVSLEAALHGTRVAASSWGAIEDYLGETIAYLEPDDPASIRRAIGAALELDPGPAAERARAFTWERSTRELLAVYESLVPSARRALRPDAGPRVGRAAPAGVPVAAAPPAESGPAALLAAAARARAAGDHEEVLRAAALAAGAGADAARVAELRAPALAHLRRFDEAEREFTVLLGSASDRHRAELGLGVLALERGEVATARAWLARATAGGDADAWTAFGLCLAQAGEHADAWDAFAEARRVDAAHRPALHGLITLASSLDRLDELEHHLRDFLARSGDDLDVRTALASCLYAAGRVGESRDAVREVLGLAPSHPLATALATELGR